MTSTERDAGPITLDATLRAIAPPPSRAGRLPLVEVTFHNNAAASGAPPDMPADFTVTSLLGEGGMGTVYLARQHILDRDVAIKLPRTSDDATVIESLLREGRLMGSLEHPSILPVHALGRDGLGRPLIVMKRVEGVTWADLLREREPGGSLDRHLEILAQVAQALEFAHRRGIVHRDVKPANVMVGELGEVYLVDWGLAFRADQPDPTPGEIAGTPAYFAPEMVAGTRPTAQTDVYLLGATLHELLTGRRKHDVASLSEAIVAASLSTPFDYPPEVPEDLAALANDATHRDVARRPPSAAAFRERLLEHARHRGALRLVRAADERLARVRARSGAADIMGHEAARLLGECRFGYQQAMEAWPASDAARRGLDACIELLVTRDVVQRSLASARGHLAELSRPSPALESRVDALEVELAIERDKQHEADRIARERDASVGAGGRIALLVTFLAVGVVGGGLGVWTEEQSGVPLSMGEIVSVDAVFLAVLVIGLAAWRRRLLANEYNRQLWAIGAIAMATTLTMDLFSWNLGVGSHVAGAIDSVATAGCFAIGAFVIGRWLFVGVAANLFAAIVGTMWPRLMTGVGTLALAVTVVALLEQARRSASR